MLTSVMIARINELARKQRENSLTEAEQVEQAQLRRTYIDVIKARVKEQVDTVQTEHPPGCGCGHH